MCFFLTSPFIVRTNQASGLFRGVVKSPDSHCSPSDARICMVAGAETLGSMRPQNPNQKANRNPRRSNNSEQDDCEEHPIPPGVGAGLLLLPDQQGVITSIRLPKDVEDVACYRYCSQRGFQKYVGNHANQSDGLHTATPGREHN